MIHLSDIPKDFWTLISRVNIEDRLYPSIKFRPHQDLFLFGCGGHHNSSGVVFLDDEVCSRVSLFSECVGFLPRVLAWKFGFTNVKKAMLVSKTSFETCEYAKIGDPLIYLDVELLDGTLLVVAPEVLRLELEPLMFPRNMKNELKSFEYLFRLKVWENPDVKTYEISPF